MSPSPHLILKVDGKMLLIRKQDIDWIEADSNRVLLHLQDGTCSLRASINSFEETLDPYCFIRINRSAMVNLDFIREFRPWLRGTYKVVLRDGTELNMHRARLERFYLLISPPLGIRSARRNRKESRS